MSDKHLIVEGLSIEFDGQTVVHNLSFTLAGGRVRFRQERDCP